MHVLMFTQRVDAGHDVLGFTVDWIRALADRVDRLDVLTGYEGSHDLPDNVTVRSYGKERGYAKPRRVATFQRHCLWYARRGDVDVAFSHMIPEFVIASWPWLRVAGVPYVLWYAHRSVNARLRVAHALVDRVVTATDASFRLPSSKLSVVGHGIDTDRFAPDDVDADTGVASTPAPDRHRLLSVGRLDPVKDVDVLIDAVGTLADRGREVTLRLVGEPARKGDYGQRLREQVEAADLDDRIEFVGPVPHERIVSEYRQAGVFLNASRTGSLDKTEVEAMACGTPVLSCNDSFVEMVEDAGLDPAALTWPADDADALADRVETLLDYDEETYRDLCSRSRAVARERHDLGRLMDRLVDVFAEVSS